MWVRCKGRGGGNISSKHGCTRERFIKKSTENDRPRAHRKALEALVGVIEKDNTNEQRKSILSVKNMLTILTKENAEIMQIFFEENDNNEANESRILFTIHSLSPQVLLQALCQETWNFY